MNRETWTNFNHHSPSRWHS